MVPDSEVEAVLDECVKRLDAGADPQLGRAGFWKTVRRVKKDPALIEEYAERIAEVDRRAFEAWVRMAFPIAIGKAVLWVGTFAALAVIAAGYYVDGFWRGALLLVGTGGLLLTTHGLGHLIVGELTGIRFTHWFIADLRRPQPGVKTDYASYLRTSPRRRAWMHASGALVTKAMPFLLLGAAWGMEAPGWAWIVLIVVGVVQIITDVTLSVKQSDWKKFNREMALARELESGGDA